MTDESYKAEVLRKLLEPVEIVKQEQVDYYMDYKNIIAMMS